MREMGVTFAKDDTKGKGVKIVLQEHVVIRGHTFIPQDAVTFTNITLHN